MPDAMLAHLIRPTVALQPGRIRRLCRIRRCYRFGVYIGPLASLRGDYGRLIVQAGANIQDGCIMHGY
ncbi:hypothetical protein ACSLO9_33125, partial [Escherichia coli]